MSGTVSIRPGTVEDAPGLRALGEAVIPATYGPIDAAYADLMLERWWALDRLSVSLETLPHLVATVGAGAGEQVVGIANLGRRDERWVMWKLYVRPDHQRTGLGSRLLTETLGLARAEGADALWLEHVDGNHAAAAFYRAHGFTDVERVATPPYPDDIWMRRDL